MPTNHRRAVRCTPTPRRAADAAPPAEFEDDNTPHCGWFDSSHDLQTGLLVQEHASTDAVLALLDLDDWLHLQLADWRPHAAQARH